jgi:DNA polymerase-4
VVIHARLLRLADQVASRLRKAGYVTRTLSLKVRFADFTTITRSRTLSRPTDVGAEIYDTIKGLYDGLGLQRVRIRLVGVRAEGLADAAAAPAQLLLGEPEFGRRDAEVAVDALRARYGSAAVRPARLVDKQP